MSKDLDENGAHLLPLKSTELKGHMRQKLIDDLASAAWSVLNFDNDRGREPEGPANWKALTSAMERALEKHPEFRLTTRAVIPLTKRK